MPSPSLPTTRRKSGIRDAMRLVDLSLVVSRDELLLRRRAGRAGGGDQDRVGIRGDELQHLSGDRGVGAVVLLLGDDLDAGRLRRVADLGEPAVAVAVGEADEADRLHAVRLHVHGDGVGHQRVALRRLEHPPRLGIRRIDDPRRGGHRDHRRLGGRHDVHHRQRVRGDRRADDDVDLVLGDELLRVRHGLRRVGGVVQHDPVDLLARRCVVGRSSKVFFSGMPSDAAGPVADSVTPTLMSAQAGATPPATASAQSAGSKVRTCMETPPRTSVAGTTKRVARPCGLNGAVSSRARESQGRARNFGDSGKPTRAGQRPALISDKES